MKIALIAHEKKKELMVQFCIAYAGILKNHSLWAASALGTLVSENSGLSVNRLIGGSGGAEEQIASRISCEEIDVLLFFRDPLTPTTRSAEDAGLLRLCDVHNVPVATNIATAEVIIMALDRGDLDWIEISKER